MLIWTFASQACALGYALYLRACLQNGAPLQLRLLPLLRLWMLFEV